MASFFVYTLKKRLAIFPSPAEVSLTKLRNQLISVGLVGETRTITLLYRGTLHIGEKHQVVNKDLFFEE
jgi:hypothetical protein